MNAEIVYLPVEAHWAATMEGARRQITQGERAMAAIALKRSGQLEFDYE